MDGGQPARDRRQTVAAFALDKGLLRVRGTLARVQGRLLVTEPKAAKSRRFVPISAPAERLLRGPRAGQAEERRAGSLWQETGFLFTTETGEPYDPAIPCGR